jgi:hypothetical protein
MAVEKKIESELGMVEERLHRLEVRIASIQASKQVQLDQVSAQIENKLVSPPDPISLLASHTLANLVQNELNQRRTCLLCCLNGCFDNSLKCCDKKCLFNESRCNLFANVGFIFGELVVTNPFQMGKKFAYLGLLDQIDEIKVAEQFVTRNKIIRVLMLTESKIFVHMNEAKEDDMDDRTLVSLYSSSNKLF